MNAPNEFAANRYRNGFLREVEEKAEDGRWVKMCMQCGVCSGSCPFGPHWAHPPQEIFMMIRAGKREEVLGSDSMWMCTSCYNCLVRCPRKLPITHIIHGLATYAHRLGIVRKDQPTRHLSVTFWKNCTRKGRANELKLTMSLYFKDGFVSGIRKALEMRNIGQGLLKAKRLNPFELFGGHKCNDQAGIKRMLDKAYELEARRLGLKLGG